MYKVCFIEILPFNDGYGEVVARVPAVEPALAFALEFHRASNVSHRISVLNPDDSLVVELVRQDNEKPSK